jgi:iron-sulfur cluster repair protein YtfE (RIC family)
MIDKELQEFGEQVWLSTEVEEIIYEAFNTQIPWILSKYEEEINKHITDHAFDAMEVHYPMIEKLISGILLKAKDDIKALTEKHHEGI